MIRSKHCSCNMALKKPTRINWMLERKHATTAFQYLNASALIVILAP
jgi:hypothetical protein